MPSQYPLTNGCEVTPSQPKATIFDDSKVFPLSYCPLFFSFLRKFCCLLLLVGTSTFLVDAQQTINFDEVVQPIDSRVGELKERLVQLAWVNNPDNAALERMMNIEDEKIQLAKKDWTKGVRATFNLNDQNVANDPTANPDAVLYPRYNIGVTFSLADVMLRPHNVKIAKEGRKISEDRVNQQKVFIRAEVFRRYNAYEASIEKLKLYTEVESVMYTTYITVKSNFEIGMATIEAYNSASGAYTEAKVDKLEAEIEVKVTKIALEELIGESLENVQRNMK